MPGPLMYDGVIEFVSRTEDRRRAKMNERETISPQKATSLRRRFRGIPDDYIAYLREVGSGNFRECQFSVRGDLLTPDELLGPGVFDWLDPKTKVFFPRCLGQMAS